MSATLGLLIVAQASLLGLPSGSVLKPPTDSAQLSSFEFTTISSPQYAGDSFALTIFAKDQFNSNYPYTGSALLTTSSGTYVSPNVVQFSNGVCQRKVIVTFAGNLYLRCFTDIASGNSNSFDVYPGAPRKLVAILPGEHLAPGLAGGRLGFPSNQTAGDTFAFDVYLTDDWYNPIGLRDDSVFFTSTDGFAYLPGPGRLANGMATFNASFRTAGFRAMVTRPAVGSSVHVDTSSLVQVVAGPFAELLLVVPGESLTPGDTASQDWQTPGKSGTPDAQFLSTPFPVSVYGCDRCWNRVTGPGDTIALRSEFALQFDPPGIELRDEAAFSVQFNTPGPNQDLRAYDWRTGLESYRTHLDIRARGAHLDVWAAETVRAGETTRC
jgi:hypothetical protein